MDYKLRDVSFLKSSFLRFPTQGTYKQVLNFNTPTSESIKFDLIHFLTPSIIWTTYGSSLCKDLILLKKNCWTIRGENKFLNFETLNWTYNLFNSNSICGYLTLKAAKEPEDFLIKASTVTFALQRWYKIKQLKSLRSSSDLFVSYPISF